MCLLVLAILGIVGFRRVSAPEDSRLLPGNGSSESSHVSITAAADYKDAAYLIEGASVQLVDGYAETAAAPGSAVKTITRYFGNELRADITGDRKQDVVFLLTQERGGSGTFYYAVAAVATDGGYVGSDGYLLGDRIAPQSIDLSTAARHVDVVAVNYADRAPSQPMTAKPSVGKTAYIKLDSETLRWGIVAADFEGESR